MRRKPLVIAILVISILVLAVFAISWSRSSKPPDSDRQEASGSSRRAIPEGTFAKADRQACDLGNKVLLRLWRGHAGERSPDIVLVPKEPNFFGSLTVPNHSGPAENLQQVPLVLYGPGRINTTGTVRDRHASITDVYPTVGKLTDVALPAREGGPLHEALAGGVVGNPRLIMVIVWDGVGRNVLDRWPDAWPTLRSLERSGTSYLDATVGSSPSITPATHANLGTGTYPRRHGVPAIYYRDEEERIVGAFRGTDPRMLNVSTFADEIDLALNNQPLVGMIAWFNWHLPMMSHGKGLRGGDADQVALIHDPADVRGNDSFYETPRSVVDFPGFDKHLRVTDQQDGKKDGLWMGHDLRERQAGSYKKDNPAWVRYQTDMVLTMLREEGYGSADAFPDLFFTNYKVADVIGHRYIMDSPEMEEVIRAQDEGLQQIVDYLDRAVKDYVLILTADHGHTPSPERTGAWAVNADELASDVDDFFGVPQDESLITGSKTAGLFLDHDVQNMLSISEVEVAAYLQDYTIRENWRGDQLPEGYQDRGEERVLSASFPAAHFPQIMRCAFGSQRPPPDLDD